MKELTTIQKYKAAAVLHQLPMTYSLSLTNEENCRILMDILFLSKGELFGLIEFLHAMDCVKIVHSMGSVSVKVTSRGKHIATKKHPFTPDFTAVGKEEVADV